MPGCKRPPGRSMSLYSKLETLDTQKHHKEVTAHGA